MNYKKNLSWILVIIWMVIIYLLSAQSANDSGLLSGGITDWAYQLLNSVIPKLNIETLHSIIRTLAHFVLYLILGVLLLNALNYNKQKRNANFVFALLISFIYAITDEIHQVFVPGRAFQIYDLLIDFLGSLIGINAFLMYSNLISKRKD